MVLLDTNVISEAMRENATQRVIDWIDAQPVETLYLSAITVAEICFGIAALPAGKRRDRLEERFERDILSAFTGRVLPFDIVASRNYAAIMARAQAAGRAIGKADGYIAAIAASRNLMVATRDVSPFEAAGLSVINPWADGG
ncbi:MAG: type II toxin-antitoxin system VapC family toxin [Rhizobiaceae bacterium]|nr:type II toxin-antitoxin system VapC family toxin [Rhizobiaceae bacterium]